MPGLAAQFMLLDLVRDRLAASSDPAQVEIANALKADPAYAYFGAIGVDLADFMPNDFTPGMLGGKSAYFEFWKIVFGIASGTTTTPGLFPTLAKLNDILGRLDKVAADEDLDSLKNMKDSGEIDQALAAMKDLATIVQNIPSTITPLTGSIQHGQKPTINVDIGQTPPPPITWAAQEFLHWKRPGLFAATLVQRARQSGDPRYLAYAYGYLCSYAGKACGAPFVNSIVGGPYRLHWWRTRWINMYNDAWIWGFYNASPRPVISNDVPNPGYDTWQSLCSANLQKRIELPGADAAALLKVVSDETGFPDVLPADFSDFWFAAFEATYGAPPPGSRFSKAGLNGAYLMTWLVLWFQTSGEVLGCLPVPPLVPPDTDCGDAPPWVDPSTAPPGDGGGPALPPEPQIETDPDVGEIVCGIILALLGIGAIFTGDLPAAGIAIVGGVDLIIAGATNINWENLRCQLYWYHLYLYNGLKALHDAAALAGIVHPYAPSLAVDQDTASLLGFQFPFDSGTRTVKSRGKRDGFPHSVWSGALPTWVQDPPASFEHLETMAYLRTEFPSFWIDDAAANPLSNGRVRIGGTWPMKTAAGSELPAEFGNAVDNAIDVLLAAGDPLPDWNLDSDRGLSFFTWEFDGAYSDPVKIKPEA